MKKWLKVLRIVLAILAFLANFFVILALPNILGVEWITGWPKFLSTVLYFALNGLVCFLIWPSEKPKEKSAPTGKQKIGVAIACVVSIAMVFGYSYWSSFSSYNKVDHYEYSPHGTSRAVVFSGRIYPVKALLFYEEKKRIDIDPYYYDITLTWLDETTLEITRIEKETGEVSTDYLRW